MLAGARSITAMRDSGYRNTAYALAELIDNAVQAEATAVEVLCIERRERERRRDRARLHEIAVLDNGSGMDAATLRMALQFGNGTRLNDRSGIGRFGMGLPNASISQASRVDVWTWRNGTGNALWTYIDLEEIDAGAMTAVPAPEQRAIPTQWSRVSRALDQTGTLVVWSKLDPARLTWKQAWRALDHTERIAGRIYRLFLDDSAVAIRLYSQEEDASEPSIDRDANVNDPLYLRPLAALPAPFDERAMFEEVWSEDTEIEFQGETHKVTARYALAAPETVAEAGTVNRGATAYGKHAASNVGVSVLRAGRELMLDDGWCIGHDPRERWWGAEVEFPPALDEVFGLTSNKQAAIHFSELARTDWRELKERGEDFIDVVRRLKEDGDPRGWLLQLSDAINRNLNELRDRIKAQSAGKRSSRKIGRRAPDDVTSAVNRAWKERSTEVPVQGDERTPDLTVVRKDLTETKQYSRIDAEELCSLIGDARLRVVFLEADFPDSFQLFNVEMKGNVTEITFNRQHPGFDDLFGAVAVDEEELGQLTKEEVVERLTKAMNATRIIFAGWARYEREAGAERAKGLRKVRFAWGQMAARFLDPEGPDEAL